MTDSRNKICSSPKFGFSRFQHRFFTPAKSHLGELSPSNHCFILESLVAFLIFLDDNTCTKCVAIHDLDSKSEKNNQFGKLIREDKSIYSIVATKNGDLITGSAKSITRWTNIQNGNPTPEVIAQIKGSSYDPPHQMLVSSDNQLYVSFWFSRQIIQIDLETISIRNKWEKVRATGLAFDESENLIGVSHDDGFDFKSAQFLICNGKNIKKFPVRAVSSKPASLPDARAAVSRGDYITILDTNTGDQIVTLKGFYSVLSIALSPDGRFLVVADLQGLHFIHPETYDYLRFEKIELHYFSADGLRLERVDAWGCRAAWNPWNHKLLLRNSRNFPYFDLGIPKPQEIAEKILQELKSHLNANVAQLTVDYLYERSPRK